MSGPADPPDPTGTQGPLPSAERRRIIAEEEFRKATAKRLDREMESSGHRLGRLLNTPAMLWLLSTGVVGLGTWLYQRHQETRQREADQRLLTARTTDEVLYRLGACDDGTHESLRSPAALVGDNPYAATLRFRHVSVRLTDQRNAVRATTTRRIASQRRPTRAAATARSEIHSVRSARMGRLAGWGFRRSDSRHRLEGPLRRKLRGRRCHVGTQRAVLSELRYATQQGPTWRWHQR